MKEFIDKLIERLEEREVQAYAKMDGGVTYQAYRNAIEIVIELAEEYKQKEYCWQSCSSTEHCKECNRLGNGDIDYYEDIGEYINCSTDTSTDCSTNLSEMPTGSEDCCEWRLIDYEANVYDTTCRNPHILLEGSPTDNSYEFCPYCGKKIKVVE